jgi:arabinogalactan endo-1,4-beta-galactosidase
MNTIRALGLLLALLAAGCGSDRDSGAPASRLLAAGTVSVAAEYKTIVQQLYISYFGRPADTGGLLNFQGQLAQLGGPTEIQKLDQAYRTSPAIKSLVDSFGSSAESAALYKGDNTQFVTAIYKNVLNRSPDDAGLKFWVNAIDAGSLTRANASLSVMAGALANVSSQGQRDGVLVRNKVAVGVNFTDALLRAPLNGYNGSIAAGQARAMLASVTADTNTSEFQAVVDALVTSLAAQVRPIASAGNDQQVAVGALATLDGSASTNAGQALTYAWSMTSAPSGSAALLASPTSVKTSFVADLAGTYQVSLVASDAKYSSAPATATVKSGAPLALGGIIMDTYLRRRWTAASSPQFNALPSLFNNGFKWIRVAVTTQSFPQLRATSDWSSIPFRSEFWSSLEVSGGLLREAADNGLRLQAMLFLSDHAADAGRQARPLAWEGLSDTELASRVELHGAQVASYYKSLGLAIEVFEIGNELDFGVCGITLNQLQIPAGIDPVNNPAWLRDNLWARGAPILQAAIRGVRSVYPDSKILLHVAGFGYSTDDIAASGFFQSMKDLGVNFDIAGLSFPYMFGGGKQLAQPYFSQPEFAHALDRIAAFGKPIQVVEFSYPADPAGATQTPAAIYPFSPDGQARYVQDFANAVRGKVQAIHYFYPDYYDDFDPSNPELQSGGLFGKAAQPRPVLRVFKGI